MTGDLVERLRAELDRLEAVALAATEGPWWHDEDEDVWRLHGVAFRIPAQLDGLIPEQVVNKQILKAPKRGTTYAEYWPDAGDAAFILAHDPAYVLRTIQAHRKIIADHASHVAPDSFTVLGEAVVVCAKCSDHNGYPDDAPCATLLAVASIYFPEGTEPT